MTPADDAIFLGWQMTHHGNYVSLFTIVKAGHPSLHSTVSEMTLRTLHLRVPRTLSPTPQRGDLPAYAVDTGRDHPSTVREMVEAAETATTVPRMTVEMIVNVST